MNNKSFSDAMRDDGFVRKHFWVKEEHYNEFEQLMTLYGFKHPGQLLSLMIKNQKKTINK